MNRDEEIRKAAGNVAIRDNKGKYAHGFLMQALREAFTEGAEWADGHPRWISVEDELPEKGDIVIVMQDAYGNIHFTACEFISAMQLCDVTDFHVRSDAYLGITKKAEITLGAVTHWMPLPQPPKEGGEQ